MRINSDRCFLQLGMSTGIIRSWFDRGEHQYGMSAGWLATPIELELVLQEPVLKAIHDVFPIANAGVMTIDRNTCYRWHQDRIRGVGINMMLRGFDTSATLFGELDDHSTTQIEFQQLKYQDSALYLFNTQVSHTVVNFDGDRYVFTVEFEHDKRLLTYDTVVKAIHAGLVELPSPAHKGVEN